MYITVFLSTLHLETFERWLIIHTSTLYALMAQNQVRSVGKVWQNMNTKEATNFSFIFTLQDLHVYYGFLSCVFMGFLTCEKVFFYINTFFSSLSAFILFCFAIIVILLLLFCYFVLILQLRKIPLFKHRPCLTAYHIFDLRTFSLFSLFPQTQF